MLITVRWGDMDALGHVNNTRYFQYFESARVAWYETLGFSAPTLSDQSGLVVVDSRAEFHKPVVYPATLQLSMGGHSPGRSSFISSYTLSIGDVLYTTGRAKIVWVDLAAGRSTPLPSVVRALLEESGHE